VSIHSVPFSQTKGNLKLSPFNAGFDLNWLLFSFSPCDRAVQHPRARCPLTGSLPKGTGTDGKICSPRD